MKLTFDAANAREVFAERVDGKPRAVSRSGLLRRGLPVGFLVLAAVVGIVVTALVLAGGVPVVLIGLVVMLIVVFGLSAIGGARLVR